jgi:hypothetical protein
VRRRGQVVNAVVVFVGIVASGVLSDWLGDVGAFWACVVAAISGCVVLLALRRRGQHRPR